MTEFNSVQLHSYKTHNVSGILSMALGLVILVSWLVSVSQVLAILH